jgi:ribonuclease BN (tRNA processing enzyme)
MYSLADAMSVKEDWGHSSNMVGVELAQLAGAKCLCLFHHEPTSTDEKLFAIHRETERLEEITRTGFPLRILTAYDGLELTV